MSPFNLEELEFATNRDPRCACVLVLDTSLSMQGDPITQLNQGLKAFQQALQSDNLAQRRVEIAIVTFGNNGVQTTQDFVVAGNFVAPTLTPGGQTPLGEAVGRALDLVQERKESYRRNSIEYYRPWIFLLTDGAPTDAWQNAAQRVQQEEDRKGIAFFTVGVGQANMQVLGQIAKRQPLHLNGLDFRAMFQWLSRSMARVSASRVGDEVPLETPAGWGTV